MATNRRRLIREKVLQILYAHEISKDPLFFIQDQQFGAMKENPAEIEFAKSLIRSVADHIHEIDGIISGRVAHWEMQRIAVIDRIVLRMAISELLYFPDIPPKVTINEAIEIAKHFSTNKSGDFVNGILDAVLAELRKSGNLVKTGRGLLDETPNPLAPPKEEHRKPQVKPPSKEHDGPAGKRARTKTVRKLRRSKS